MVEFSMRDCGLRREKSLEWFETEVAGKTFERFTLQTGTGMSPSVRFKADILGMVGRLQVGRASLERKVPETGEWKPFAPVETPS